MPRKLRRLKTRVAKLTPDWIDFLLDGKTRRDVPFEDRARRLYDCFLEFDPHTPEEIRGLWIAHKAELLTEWQRRGRAGAPWCAGFDAGQT